ARRSLARAGARQRGAWAQHGRARDGGDRRAGGLDALGRRPGQGRDARLLAGRGARAAGAGGAAAGSVRVPSWQSRSLGPRGLAIAMARMAAGAPGAVGIRGVGSRRSAVDPARAALVVVAGAARTLRDA